MGLREAIASEESFRAAEVDWRLRVRGSVDERLLAELQQAVAVREAHLKMAEAAIAYVEYQLTSVSDTNVDGTMYIRERGELWDRFMEARAKVKAMNQQ